MKRTQMEKLFYLLKIKLFNKIAQLLFKNQNFTNSLRIHGKFYMVFDRWKTNNI